MNNKMNKKIFRKFYLVTVDDSLQSFIADTVHEGVQAAAKQV